MSLRSSAEHGGLGSGFVPGLYAIADNPHKCSFNKTNMCKIQSTKQAP